MNNSNRIYKLSLRDGKTINTPGELVGSLLIHKSLRYVTAKWSLSHLPTGGQLATGTTKRGLLELGKQVEDYARFHLPNWASSDTTKIFIAQDGTSHHNEIRKICERTKP